jgi:hypothetical protein
MPNTSPSFNGTSSVHHAIAGLAPEHLADLRKSDLSDEQIAAAGLYTEDDPAAVRVTLGWQRSAACLGPSLVIPFPHADGSPSDYSRVKPLHPREFKKPGKPPKLIKYESPIGRPNRAYFPPGVWELLNDPSVPLLLTEGEKKALKAMQEGFACIGLVGVWGWQVARSEAEKKANAPRTLIPDLDSIVWEGRVVYPIFDSDALTNPLVRSAEWHLAKVLENRGATVLIVRLPPGPGGAKVGLDDFLVAHGPEALQQHLDEAQPPERPKREDPRPVVYLSTNEYEVRDKVIAVLAERDADLYQRAGALVRVSRDVEPGQHMKPSGAPRITSVPLADLRARITKHVRLVQLKKVKGKKANGDG